jgi:hypothetical protein
LENDFFGSLEDSGGNKMNRAGLIALGKNSDDNNLDDNGAYKKGIEKFHLVKSDNIKHRHFFNALDRLILYFSKR